MTPPPDARLAVCLAVAASTLLGCGAAGEPAGTRVAAPMSGDSAAGSEDACPPPDAAGDSAIDWVPFVVVDGLHFEATFPADEVAETALGPVVATVRCTISETVGNPDYRLRDGDAAYLPAGTELREVVGYRTDFRLAAYEDGGWRVYEAYHRDDARTGADLLDLDGKVAAVHLVEGDTGTGILDTVDDPAVVAEIVTALLAAPVIPADELSDDRWSEPPLFVRFELRDGTSVQRAWAVQAGVVGPDLRAPEALTRALAPAAP